MSDGQTWFNELMKLVKEEKLRDSGILGLGDLHAELGKVAPEASVWVEFHGFEVPAGGLDSYRGYYSDLAFEVSEELSVAQTRSTLKDYLEGQVYEGYKGGEYRADSDTLVWVAPYSESSGVGVTGVEVRGDKVFLTTVNTDDN